MLLLGVFVTGVFVLVVDTVMDGVGEGGVIVTVNDGDGVRVVDTEVVGFGVRDGVREGGSGEVLGMIQSVVRRSGDVISVCDTPTVVDPLPVTCSKRARFCCLISVDHSWQQNGRRTREHDICDRTRWPLGVVSTTAHLL